MNTSSAIAREQFERDGFINGGAVLSHDEVEELREELERVIREQNDEAKPQPVRIANLNRNHPEAPVWQIVNIWQASSAFRRHMQHPKILEMAGYLSGARELRIWHDQIQYKPSITGGVNLWHQDSPLWPTLQPKDAQVTAWIALDDVDEENGCMSMVCGSHRWGDRKAYLRTIEEFDALPEQDPTGGRIEARLCPVKMGHVHFHHSLAWHASHANTSDRPRRAIAYHFMREDTLFDASGSHIMKPFIGVQDGQRLEGDTFPAVVGGQGLMEVGGSPCFR